MLIYFLKESENLKKDQSIFPLVIILLVVFPITFTTFLENIDVGHSDDLRGWRDTLTFDLHNDYVHYRPSWHCANIACDESP